MSEAVNEEQTQEPTQAPVEEPTAQEDDLDSLLKEFDEPQEKPTQAPAQTDTDMAEIRQFMETQRQKDIRSGLSESAKIVQQAAGDAARLIPPSLFEAALHKEAFDNPKITEAFERRGSNPEGWKKIAESLGRKIAKDIPQIDQAATESWAAAEGAMNSAKTSTRQEEAPDFKSMSDQEFAMWKARHG